VDNFPLPDPPLRFILPGTSSTGGAITGAGTRSIPKRSLYSNASISVPQRVLVSFQVCEKFAHQTPGDDSRVPDTPSVYLSPVEALSVPQSPAPGYAPFPGQPNDKLEAA
jgi:hypothetical protein